MKKNYLILLTMVGALAALGAGCAQPESNNTGVPNTNTTTANNDDGRDDIGFFAIIEPGEVVVKTSTGTIKSVTQSYATALSIYGKSGARFQFSNCSGTPGSLTIKRGTKFMIDNRDSESHQIKIGTMTYQLKAYDFAVVSVSKSGNFNITCDGGGSASVNVQN